MRHCPTDRSALRTVSALHASILLLISQAVRWRKRAPYLRLAGRGHCTVSRREWLAGRNASLRLDWRRSTLYLLTYLRTDIAIFVLKRDVKLQLTNHALVRRWEGNYMTSSFQPGARASVTHVRGYDKDVTSDGIMTVSPLLHTVTAVPWLYILTPTTTQPAITVTMPGAGPLCTASLLFTQYGQSFACTGCRAYTAQ